MNFQDLQLNSEMLRAVKRVGYRAPTPIQVRAIPHILKGRDIVGCAQTGSGKTAAFALPIVQMLAPTRGKRPIRVLALTPTRELAAPNRRGVWQIQPRARAAAHGHFRRRGSAAAGQCSAARRRHRDSDARSPAGLDESGLYPAGSAGVLHPGRSRPHVGYGLHQRCQAHHQTPAKSAADHAILRPPCRRRFKI